MSGQRTCAADIGEMLVVGQKQGEFVAAGGPRCSCDHCRLTTEQERTPPARPRSQSLKAWGPLELSADFRSMSRAALVA